MPLEQDEKVWEMLKVLASNPASIGSPADFLLLSAKNITEVFMDDRESRYLKEKEERDAQ